jgi:hypothetical protein
MANSNDRVLTTAESLRDALRETARHPLRTLLPNWSWKSACISASLRATTFFVTNLCAGHAEALRAGMVEAGFAIFAAGVMGSIAQRLRHAQPLWATALFVWLGMPSLMLSAQLAVHTVADTPHMQTGLIASFCFAATASSFSWYAMREGALLGGAAQTSLLHDARQLPRIVLGYVLFVVLVVPRSILGVIAQRQQQI